MNITIKRILLAAALLLGIVTTSCSTSKNTQTLLINSEKIDCMGVAPMKCLQVKNLDKADAEWETMYANIKGFEYEPGYIYKIKVKVKELDKKQVPADGSSIEYTLEKVISKEAVQK
ncbi:MAG: DUF4377 domain-containing protein [Tannerellaceae bacterium]